VRNDRGCRQRHGELVDPQLQVTADHIAAGAPVEQADPDVGCTEEAVGYATELVSVGQGIAQ
jgi:hypothetical protein